MNLDKYFRSDVKYPPFSDKVVWRPLAKRITTLFLKSSITANQVSVLKFLFLLLTGIVYAQGVWIWFAIGGFLLVLANDLDYVDGMIARIRGTGSERGRWMDNITEDTGEIIVILGLTAGLCGLYPWPLMVVVGSFTILFKLILGGMGKQKTAPKTTVFSSPLPPRVYWTMRTVPILLLITGIFNIIVVGFILMCTYYGIRLFSEVMRRSL